ncbi:MAG: hypothetical protein ACQEXJ_24795 [Myxococcota bacterium]
MHRTVEAIVDEDGNVRLVEQLRLRGRRRALVTILDDDLDGTADRVPETALLSEPALAEDWNRPEEDEAWASLEPDPSS